MSATITATNLSQSYTGVTARETSVSLAPGQTATFTVDTATLDLLLPELQSLAVKGIVSYTVSSTVVGTVTAKAVGTTAALTYYVDHTNGSDLNDGLSLSTSLKTINAALSKVPLQVGHAVVISIKSGTYAEILDLGFTIKTGGSLAMNSADGLVAYTPATGIQSGTFDASFAGAPANQAFTATCAGGGWTAHDLRGKILYVPSIATYFPIADNTATSIDVPAHVTNNTWSWDLRGLAFQIVQSPVTIKLPTSPVSTQGVVLVDAQTSDNANAAVVLTNLIIDKTGASAGIQHMSGNLRLNQVVITGSGNGSAYNNSVQGVTGECQNSFFGGSTIVSGAVALRLDQVVIDVGNSFGTGLLLNGGYVNSGEGLLIQNGAQGIGLGINTLPATFLTTVYTWIRSGPTYNITTGVELGHHSQLSGPVVILSPTSHGISALQGNFHSGHNTVKPYNSIFAGMVVGAGGSGIHLASDHNSFDLSGCSITGSAAYGINMGGSKLAAFNNVVTSSATAMSGNTTADFSDGVNNKSIADLRAATDKTLVEATERFNRIAEF